MIILFAALIFMTLFTSACNEEVEVFTQDELTPMYLAPRFNSNDLIEITDAMVQQEILAIIELSRQEPLTDEDMSSLEYVPDKRCILPQKYLAECVAVVALKTRFFTSFRMTNVISGTVILCISACY